MRRLQETVRDFSSIFAANA